MKYTYYILRNIIPEWIFMYLNYSLLKTYLGVSGQLKEFLILAKKTQVLDEYRAIKQQVMTNNFLMSKVDSDHKEFLHCFKVQTDKVRNFTLAKYNDMKEKICILQTQIQIMKQQQCFIKDLTIKQGIHKAVQDESSKNIVESLKIFNLKKNILKNQAFKLYHEGIIFDKYLKVNQEGMRKILKKYYKKMLKVVRAGDYTTLKLQSDQTQLTQIDIKVKQIMFAVEKLLTNNFYEGDPCACKYYLRKYHQKFDQRGKGWFLFGLSTGLCIFLLVLTIILNQYVSEKVQEQVIKYLFPVSRGIFLFMIYYWGICLDVFFWWHKKINYKQFFEFNFHFSTLSELFQRVVLLTGFILLIIVIYMCQAAQISQFLEDVQIFDPLYLPIILWTVFMIYLFLPTKIAFNGEGRIWLMRRIIQGFQLMNYKIREMDLFITEQFTSLVIPFSDIGFTILEYYSLCFNDVDYDIDLGYYWILIYTLIVYSIFLIQIMANQIKSEFTVIGMLRGTQCITSMIIKIMSVYSSIDEKLVSGCIIFGVLNSFLLIAIWTFQFNYIKQSIDIPNNSKIYKLFLNHGSPTRFYTNLVIVIPFSINQSLSLTTNAYKHLLGTYALYYIFGVALIEIMRRCYWNYMIVEKEHRKNQDLYTSVGLYDFPFEQHPAQSPSKSNKISEAMGNSNLSEIQYIQLYRQTSREVSPNVREQIKKNMTLTEIIQKEEEKLLGKSAQEFRQTRQTQDIMHSIADFEYKQDYPIEQINKINKFYKKDIQVLYDKYQIPKR